MAGLGMAMLGAGAMNAASSAGSSLMGGLTDWITGRSRKDKKFQKEMQAQQFANEKEMMGLQYDYNTKMGQQNQNWAEAMNNKIFSQNKQMNEINYGQAKEMWEKNAEYNSASAQKERLNEAGLNPALLYGGGGASGQSNGSLS